MHPPPRRKEPHNVYRVILCRPSMTRAAAATPRWGTMTDPSGARLPLDTLLSDLLSAALERRPPTREQALALLDSSDEDVLDVVAAAGRVRRAFFGRRVKLNYLVNMKSGLCPEDCFYCSQRLGSEAEILKYSWIKADEATELAAKAVGAGAKRVCLVASGRGPSDRDVERVADTVAAIKGGTPDVEVCVCLGLLKDGQAARLAAAGADAYNHNLNTAQEKYADICTTHTFADRVSTLRGATAAGLSPCSGAIFGMGESDEDVVSVAFALRELDPDSVPVNFLIPFEGTPLGGREIHLRTMQPLALHVANAVFLGDYLTSEGAAGADDLAMIADAGFVVEGREEGTLPAARAEQVAVRRRGAGTQVPANT
jgi:biotin synthase